MEGSLGAWLEQLAALWGLMVHLAEDLPRFLRDFPLALLVLPLLLRRLESPERLDASWSSRIDLGLALAAGLIGSLFISFWMARYHLPGGGVTASDFDQYCTLTAHVRDGIRSPDHYDRSLASSILPGLLARRLGIMDGLAMSSLLSTFLLCAGLYLWGRALHSRLAGLCAVVLAGSLGSLSLLARFLTFYPQWAAAFTLTAASAACALRWHTWQAALATGCWAGLSLVLDVRGLLWALPPLLLVLVSGLVRAGGSRTLRLAALLAPVVLSYFVAGELTLPKTTRLETQVAHFKTDGLKLAQIDTNQEPTQPKFKTLAGFLWGYSNPLDIPNTYLRLLKLDAQRQELAESDWVHALQERRVIPWMKMALVAMLIALDSLRRRPWAMLALIGTTAPFLIALWQASQVWAHLRVLSTATPAIPVLLGVAFVALFTPSKRQEVDSFNPLRSLHKRVQGPIGLAGLLLLVLGVIPSWLSPVAAWRTHFFRDNGVSQTLVTLDSRPRSQMGEVVRCWGALRRDRAAGRPVPGLLFGPHQISDQPPVPPPSGTERMVTESAGSPFSTLSSPPARVHVPPEAAE